MIFQKTITTPANTSRQNEQATVLKIPKGLIYKVEILFPPGPLGYAFLRVADGNYQLWPTESGEYFTGDDQTISFDDLYLKVIPPYEFVIYTYNLDDTYEHDIIFRMGMVSKDVYLARFLPHLGYQEFVKMLDDLAKEQQAEVLARMTSTIENPLNFGTGDEED